MIDQTSSNSIFTPFTNWQNFPLFGFSHLRNQFPNPEACMLLTNVFCCGFTFRPAGAGLMLLMDYLGIHFDFEHSAVEMCRKTTTTVGSSSLMWALSGQHKKKVSSDLDKNLMWLSHTSTEDILIQMCIYMYIFGSCCYPKGLAVHSWYLSCKKTQKCLCTLFLSKFTSNQELWTL